VSNVIVVGNVVTATGLTSSTITPGVSITGTVTTGGKGDSGPNTVTGLIAAGTGISITGSGTTVSPAIISSSGSGSGVQQIATMQTKTASFTAVAGLKYSADATSGAITATLPTTNTAGQRIVIQKSDVGVNLVNIVGTINGTASNTSSLRSQNQGKELEADGTGNWNVIAGDVSVSALDNRYQNVFNVKSYGAIGNNTADDTTSIQAAINAANTAGGGIVYFPTGTYKISTKLTVYSHIKLQGNGDGPVDGAGAGGGTAPSQINQTATAQAGIYGLDVIHFSIADLCINGPNSGTATGVQILLGSHGDSRYLNFTNVTIQRFGVDGLEIDTPIMSSFTKVITYGNLRYGFNLRASNTSAGTSAFYNACWAHYNGSNGWNIDHQVYSSFEACGSDFNTLAGFNINNCQGISIVGTGAESNTGNSFKIGGASYNVSLLSCWSFQNSSIALYVTGNSIATQVIGFHENTPTGTPTASIKVDAGSTVSLLGYFVVTAMSLATNTTMILNDAAGNMTIPGTATASGNVTSLANMRAQNFELNNTNGGIPVNATYNAGWKYITTGVASLIAADGAGGLIFYTAPSGSAGAAVTFTQRSTITPAGFATAVLKVTGGTPGVGKVLTDDGTGTGIAVWTTPSAGGSGITRNISTGSTNVTLGATAATDYVYVCTGSASYTVTLPTAASNTNMYTVTNQSTVNQTLATTSSQTINGSTTATIIPGQSLDVVASASNWYII
jgi:hypothetical protein